ncbi:MAG: ATP synthase subunit I [Deltaproteobacteria bacterium]|nr:ATP synthase subunit I [Deltaproteobacteria bacterium]
MSEEVEPGGPAAVEASPEAARHLERNNLLLVVVGTAAFGFTQDFRQVLSFLAGGILTVVNLRLFRLIVAGMLGQKPTKKGRLIAQVIVKFFGLMAALTFLMLVVKPQPVPFLLGLSTVVVAITLEGIFGIFRSE